MRPADSSADEHSNGARTTSALDAVHPTAGFALGAAVCAICRDPDAAPTLAGDRGRGPDHLYLVCDRCGGRWQSHGDTFRAKRAD